MPREKRARKPPNEPSVASDTDDIVLEAPTEIDPYEVLGLTKAATADEIKKAYRKAALRHHPDKVDPEQKEEAHTKFQEVAFAYGILSDEGRRKRYDTTGNTADSLDDDDFDWTDFFRSQKAEVISGNKLEQFKQEYQGSAEERDDILHIYTEYEGDMDALYEHVMCSNVLEDDVRFRKIIDTAIESGEVGRYKQYDNESKKKRAQRLKNAKAEEVEAMQMAEELGVKEQLFGNKKSTSAKRNETDTDSLQAIIQARQQNRAESFFDRLESKYSGGTSGKKSKRKSDEPPEDAFRRNAKKMKGRG